MNPITTRLLLALAFALAAAPAVHGQPATVPLSTPVAALAREALGAQPGMAVAGA